MIARPGRIALSDDVDVLIAPRRVAGWSWMLSMHDGTGWYAVAEGFALSHAAALEAARAAARAGIGPL